MGSVLIGYRTRGFFARAPGVRVDDPRHGVENNQGREVDHEDSPQGTGVVEWSVSVGFEPDGMGRGGSFRPLR